ncbi:hypothetical protein [Chryseobacterium sp. SL1]|uniref:hypothetical protein n=1 Tax=Chryseobacterium sp. SL1 TaxID=2995159 RepID=UPI00227CCEAF|nr:hypothetical protein [Chryseobacterium sp. SL1]
MDYSLDLGSDGKTQVVKHGTKEITRDGFEYELTINFEIINENHLAKASKDRTGLFMNKPEFVITSATGQLILEWCNSGAVIKQTNNQNTFTGDSRFSQEDILNKISASNTIAELLAIYKQYPEYQQELKPEYETRKSFLMNLSNPQNFSTNGKHY